VTRSDDTSVPLDTTDGSAGGVAFWDLLNSYLHNRSESKSVDTEKQKMMRVSHIFPEIDKNCVSGVLKTGNYGYAAVLENVDTGVTKTREVADCQLMPLFFRFDFKKGKDKGILLLQRYGIYGAKTALEDDFNMFLADRIQDIKLVLRPIIDVDAIEKMFAGQLKEIHFISHEIPADIADKIKLDVAETQGTLKMVLVARRKTRWYLPEFLRPLYQDGGCVEIQNVKYQDAKLVIKLDGKKRTICLTDLDRMRSMPLDITQEVKIDEEGHPTFFSLAQKAEEIVPSFKRTLGW
jgi:hypothetical protein